MTLKEYLMQLGFKTSIINMYKEIEPSEFLIISFGALQDAKTLQLYLRKEAFSRYNSKYQKLGYYEIYEKFIQKLNSSTPSLPPPPTSPISA